MGKKDEEVDYMDKTVNRIVHELKTEISPPKPVLKRIATFIQYAYSIGYQKRESKSKEGKVIMRCAFNGIYKRFNSVEEASEKMGVDKNKIYRNLLGYSGGVEIYNGNTGRMNVYQFRYLMDKKSPDKSN